MTAGKMVKCLGHGWRSGRMIAYCKTDEVADLSAKLIASGLAWADMHSINPKYASLEKKARQQKIGIWQYETQTPWEYRAKAIGGGDARQP